MMSLSVPLFTQTVADFVRLNSPLKPSEMCGVFLGVRCSLRDSEKLNWTINIPSKKSNHFNDLGSVRRKREGLPSFFSSSSSSGKKMKLQRMRGRRRIERMKEEQDDRDPLHLSLSDMNTRKWFERLVQNKERVEDENEGRRAKLVSWTGSLPFSRNPSKIRQSFSDQRTRIHNNGDEDDDDGLGITKEQESVWRHKEVFKERTGIQAFQGIKEEGMTNFVKNPSGKEEKRLLKFLQITDIHFDPYFSPGTRTDCGEPVCCRSNNGPANSKSSMAGLWGDYMECDTPYFTVENSLQRIRTRHPDVDVWFMTGDLPPHDIWEYNRNETLAHIRFTSWLIDQYSGDTPVLPVIGNHEAVPINR